LCCVNCVGVAEELRGLERRGDALDPAGGAPVRMRAEADPPELLRGTRSWTADGLPFTARLALGSERGASGRITVELLAATCAADACRLRRTQRAYDLVLT
ncbi:MAG: hypothetical protein H0V81_03335, partial [Solirubrobacterales bacterium]|nr:hypothetical protein [Solirubrobacterales bacterium]